jgi:hypothetical protein
MQAASKRFENRETLIPCPPLGGVLLWAIQGFGMVAVAGAAWFFYLFFG